MYIIATQSYPCILFFFFHMQLFPSINNNFFLSVFTTDEDHFVKIGFPLKTLRTINVHVNYTQLWNWRVQGVDLSASTMPSLSGRQSVMTKNHRVQGADLSASTTPSPSGQESVMTKNLNPNYQIGSAEQSIQLITTVLLQIHLPNCLYWGMR